MNLPTSRSNVLSTFASDYASRLGYNLVFARAATPMDMIHQVVVISFFIEGRFRVTHTTYFYLLYGPKDHGEV